MQFSAFFLYAFVALPALASPFPQSSEDTTNATYTGRGTWFNTGLGACGKVNVDTDAIVALGSALYGTGSNNSPYCDRPVHITNLENGNTATAIVRDSCPGCGVEDLDMTPAVFEQLASLDQGVVQISWYFSD